MCTGCKVGVLAAQGRRGSTIPAVQRMICQYRYTLCITNATGIGVQSALCVTAAMLGSGFLG